MESRKLRHLNLQQNPSLNGFMLMWRRYVHSGLLCAQQDAAALRRHIACVEDTEALRAALPAAGLVAFVSDGSVLPRYVRSGRSRSRGMAGWACGSVQGHSCTAVDWVCTPAIAVAPGFVLLLLLLHLGLYSCYSRRSATAAASNSSRESNSSSSSDGQQLQLQPAADAGRQEQEDLPPTADASS